MLCDINFMIISLPELDVNSFVIFFAVQNTFFPIVIIFTEHLSFCSFKGPAKLYKNIY